MIRPILESTVSRVTLSMFAAAAILLAAGSALAGEAPNSTGEPSERSATAPEQGSQTDEETARIDREFGDVGVHVGPSTMLIVPYLTGGVTLHLGRHVGLMARVEGGPWMGEWIPLYFASGNVRVQFPNSWKHTAFYTNIGIGTQIPVRLAPLYKLDLGVEHVRADGMTLGAEIGGGAVYVDDRTGLFPHLEARALVGYQF